MQANNKYRRGIRAVGVQLIALSLTMTVAQAVTALVARHVVRGHDAISELEFVDTGAQRLDDTCNLVAQHEWGPGLAVPLHDV